ncbi:hypothetical protein [Nocardioides sp.]|uniref:hypothetical protein n=1 Tax=Nocardioides sp. TaxID=35761 RepID=UPI002605A0F8|nr:hypothetical protein [Nocardioides sp.]MDI6908711.1 hypothetical protein [Nocardioides sp.]
MTENPRRRVLRRARHATAGIVITAVAGTAGLAAVAADATGASGPTGGPTTTDTGSRQDPGSRRDASTGTGVTQAPAGQPQATTSAS